MDFWTCSGIAIILGLGQLKSLLSFIGYSLEKNKSLLAKKDTFLQESTGERAVGKRTKCDGHNNHRISCYFYIVKDKDISQSFPCQSLVQLQLDEISYGRSRTFGL